MAETTEATPGAGAAAGTTETPPPASAAAAHAAEPAAETPPADEGQPAQGATPASAAAAHAAEKPPAKEEPAADLGKMTDEEYAKLVQPDVEGEEVDRSLITPMAKELREAGIQPAVMAKVAGIYRKAVAEAVAKDEAARAARMDELTAKCNAEVTAEEWKDFGAAYRDHIAKDPALKHIVDHTELGSNPAFIRLIALAGATIRVDSAPPASASAGSGHTDLERAVFERTVPKDLR